MYYSLTFKYNSIGKLKTNDILENNTILLDFNVELFSNLKYEYNTYKKRIKYIYKSCFSFGLPKANSKLGHYLSFLMTSCYYNQVTPYH